MKDACEKLIKTGQILITIYLEVYKRIPEGKEYHQTLVVTITDQHFHLFLLQFSTKIKIQGAKLGIIVTIGINYIVLTLRTKFFFLL